MLPKDSGHHQRVLFLCLETMATWLHVSTTTQQPHNNASVFGAGLAIQPDNPLRRVDAQGFSLQLLPMDVEDAKKVWTVSRQVRREKRTLRADDPPALSTTHQTTKKVTDSRQFRQLKTAQFCQLLLHSYLLPVPSLHSLLHSVRSMKKSSNPWSQESSFFPHGHHNISNDFRRGQDFLIFSEERDGSEHGKDDADSFHL